MRFTSVFSALFALASFAPAQLDISNHIDCNTGSGHSYIDDSITSYADWDAQLRVTDVQSSIDGAPGLGRNFAAAWARFEEPIFGDTTLRTRAFAERTSDASDAPVYLAESIFESKHHLSVETGGVAGDTISLKLRVPMHGFLAANCVRGIGTNDYAVALASSETQVSDADGHFVASSSGKVQLSSDRDGGFGWFTDADWHGAVHETDVLVEDGVTTSTRRGVELHSEQVISVGTAPAQSSVDFFVDFGMLTFAQVGISGGQFAMADFSGTGGYEVQAFDAAGNPFHDFTVRPVPEPASLAALGLGLAALLRRRSRS